MKTMSQVSKLSECPETLEEARLIIDDLTSPDRNHNIFEYGKKIGRSQLISAVKELLEIPTITQ